MYLVIISSRVTSSWYLISRPPETLPPASYHPASVTELSLDACDPFSLSAPALELLACRLSSLGSELGSFSVCPPTASATPNTYHDAVSKYLWVKCVGKARWAASAMVWMLSLFPFLNLLSLNLSAVSHLVSTVTASRFWGGVLGVEECVLLYCFCCRWVCVLFCFVLKQGFTV